jgi:hypothetical protein
MVARNAAAGDDYKGCENEPFLCYSVLARYTGDSGRHDYDIWTPFNAQTWQRVLLCETMTLTRLSPPECMQDA